MGTEGGVGEGYWSEGDGLGSCGSQGVWTGRCGRGWRSAGSAEGADLRGCASRRILGCGGLLKGCWASLGIAGGFQERGESSRAAKLHGGRERGRKRGEEEGDIQEEEEEKERGRKRGLGVHPA